MSNSMNKKNKNKPPLGICKIFIYLLLIISFLKLSTQAQPLLGTPHDNISRVYVFFDQSHSFVQKGNSLIPTNYITVDSKFTSDISTNIFGSEHFCKHIFYFSGNKIIFYNPSQQMSSYVWCQVQLTNKKTKRISNYKFALNRTFSSWCQEKETNLSIGKTLQAILNIFDSKVCTDNISPILTRTRVLNLSNTHLDDISPLAGFLQVRSLWLDNNEIENVESLGTMQNLVFLSLNNNYISNAKSLGDLLGLRWIFLNNNQIINIDFVHNLKTLKFIGLNGNLIGDPTPLYEVSSSTSILADGNPFTKSYCKKGTQNNKLKNSFFLKNCLENASLKSTPPLKFISAPFDSKQQKSEATEKTSSSHT